jgi:hypothetical protein
MRRGARGVPEPRTPRAVRAGTPRRALWGALAALAIAAAPAGRAATVPPPGCPLPPAAGRVLADGAVQAAWAVIDAPAIALGEHFSLRVQACPADAVLLRVDASMPAHRHGMNYRPSITPLGPGAWRVDGLLFHMRGDWELVLALRHGDRLHTLRDPVVLP